MSDRLLNASPDTSDMSDVPERFDPATMRGEIIEAEHLARYRWVSSLAAGHRVLDAGCGTAYGSALLADAGALEVVGVDRASDVLELARPGMPAAVTLEVADVTALPYESGRFDLVVCFEVIEHLDDPGRALDEFLRVLGPEGVLAVSSPNRDMYSPGNPHHVHEYTPTELEQALSTRFGFVRLERQHTWITSGALDSTRFRFDDDRDLGADVSVRKLAADELGAELYTLALAGQTELPETAPTFELAAPVELRKWNELWHEQAQTLERQAQTLERQAQMLTDQEQALTSHAAYRDQSGHEIEELRHQLGMAEADLARIPLLDGQVQELVALNDELLQLNRELTQREEDLDELVAISHRYTVLVESTSWKLTRPLRQVVALVRKLGN